MWVPCVCVAWIQPLTFTWADTSVILGEMSKNSHFSRHHSESYCDVRRLCGLVVRVSGYWYRGPGFDPRRSSGSGTGSTQPREVKLRSYLNKKKSSGSRFRKQRLTAVGPRCANHVTPLYPQKLAPTSPTGGGRSVGMVRSRTKATEFSLFIIIYCNWVVTQWQWLFYM